jgi:hypothetical protein
MTELTGTIDGVIGVDTHRDSLAAAATDPVGGVLAQTSVSADAAGYQQLLAFARAQVPGRRCWAVEGAGSYGAGLTAFLQAHGERVVEVGRPKRPARRTGAKSNALDAVRAGREALSRQWLARPRQRGQREALWVLQVTRADARRHLKALLVTAPESLRAACAVGPGCGRPHTCAALTAAPTDPVEYRATVRASPTRLSGPWPPIRRPGSSARSWGCWLGSWRRRCSPSPAWGRSPPPRYVPAGRIQGGCARRPRSPCSPVLHPSRPPLDACSAIGSTVVATATSTGRCTPSS